MFSSRLKESWKVEGSMLGKILSATGRRNSMKGTSTKKRKGPTRARSAVVRTSCRRSLRVSWCPFSLLVRRFQEVLTSTPRSLNPIHVWCAMSLAACHPSAPHFLTIIGFLIKVRVISPVLRMTFFVVSRADCSFDFSSPSSLLDFPPSVGVGLTRWPLAAAFLASIAADPGSAPVLLPNFDVLAACASTLPRSFLKPSLVWSRRVRELMLGCRPMDLTRDS
mmetsp:Transcript_1636/g.3811  ORF Transcript_1636/g.3811 Transcript_1636/m.3811 type:complete len:222 (+) Transcript_1636:2042-2707(+)